MFALISIASRTHEAESQPVDESQRLTWWQRLSQSATDWLFESIPFPGQWPISNGLAQQYNRKMDTPLLPALDDRNCDER